MTFGIRSSDVVVSGCLQGAFWSLMLALVIGLIRLVIKFSYQGQGHCGSDDREVPAILSHFHYMYFALSTTLLTAVVALVISFLTKAPDPKFVSSFSALPGLGVGVGGG